MCAPLAQSHRQWSRPRIRTSSRALLHPPAGRASKDHFRCASVASGPPGRVGRREPRRGAGWLTGPPQRPRGLARATGRPPVALGAGRRAWARSRRYPRTARAGAQRTLGIPRVVVRVPLRLCARANAHRVLMCTCGRASARDARPAGHAARAKRDLKGMIQSGLCGSLWAAPSLGRKPGPRVDCSVYWRARASQSQREGCSCVCVFDVNLAHFWAVSVS